MNHRLHEELKRIARASEIARYGQIAPIVGLDMGNPNDREKMSRLLSEISEFEHQQGRPLLSAVVIHWNDNTPGTGFFTLAGRLKKYDGGDRLKFFISELRSVHEHWKAADLARES